MITYFQKPWVIAAIGVVILVVATWGGASALTFKKDVLTAVMPSLLTGLVAIAAITERATAVLNDIWFGPTRAKAEDDVRLVNRKVNETAAKVEAARAVITEAARAGDMNVFTANAAVLDAAPVEKHASEIRQTDEMLAQVKARETYARLSLAFIVAMLVSAVGVRTLAQLFDLATLSSDQLNVFRVIDIVMTAGVLTGGTAGISAISELLGTYVTASRKKAMENP